MSIIHITAPCCGDIQVDRSRAVVSICESDAFGTLLFDCTECETELLRDLTPEITEEVVGFGVRLVINADIGDTEVRRGLLEGETTISTLDVLGARQSKRWILDLELLANREPEFAGDGPRRGLNNP